MEEKTETLNMSEIREQVRMLVIEAAAILKKYRVKQLDAVEKGTGGLISVTTEADLEVENFLKSRLAQVLLGSSVLAEETPVESLDSFRDTPLLWVIDPIDGTANFSRGDSHSISVGLVDKGESVLGVVHTPKDGVTYWAQTDKAGAFCIGPDGVTKELRVSVTEAVERARVDTDISAMNCSGNFALLSRIAPPIGQVLIRGTSVWALGGKLANGETDAFFHSDLKPWDVAAAVLIAEKAGAKITALDGDQFNMFQRHVTILAANPVLHKQLVSLIKEKNEK